MIATLALLSTLAARADDPVSLQLRYPAGRTVESRTLSDMKMSMNMGGHATDMTMHQATWMRQEAVAGKGDGLRLQTSLDRFATRMDSGVMKIDYDSKRDAGKAPPAAVAPMVDALNAPFVVDMSADGNMTGIEGGDDFRARIEAKLPADQKKAFDTAFSDKALEDLVDQATQNLPDHPVSVGETWSNDMVMPMPSIGTLVIEQDFTLMRIDIVGGHRIAVIGISFKSDQDPDVSNPAVKLSITSMRGKGQSTFDLDQGLWQSSNMDLHTAVTATSNVQGTSFTMQMTADSHTESYTQVVDSDAKAQ